MSEHIAVELGNIQITMLLPLWGRAVETMKPEPLLVDRTAADIITKIDYDFSVIARNTKELSQLAWIVRSLRMDAVIREFLRKYPKATIVNIGCGLDTTFDRIDNGSLLWYDMDLPDVIELRKKFIGETDRRKFIACSFLDRDWLNRIEVRENVLFMAAGVFYYFEEYQIREFFIKIAGSFPGSEICFDACSPYGVRVANKLVIQNSGLDEKSFLKWGIKNIKEIESWDDRIRVMHEYSYFRNLKKSLTCKNRIMGLVSDLLKIQYIVHAGFSR
ncbi:class I SAM-dependent methyltransferase [bacterium]|nr:class I SAM-dependent methyltransferase [bacterium]